MGTSTSKHPPPPPPPPPSPPPLTPPYSAVFTCEICIEPIPTTHKFQNRDMCSHNFCTDCVSKYIEVRVVDDAASDVACPCPACQLPLDPIACREVLRKDTFVRWCDNLCEKAILEFDRRFCPNR